MGHAAFADVTKTVQTTPAEAKLRGLLIDVLLIDADEYRDDYGPAEIETWDSLAVVALAGAIQRVFGYSMSPEQMVSLENIGDIKQLLREQGHALP